MKRIVLLILALFLVCLIAFTVSACDNGESKGESSTTPTITTTTGPTTDPDNPSDTDDEEISAKKMLSNTLNEFKENNSFAIDFTINSENNKGIKPVRGKLQAILNYGEEFSFKFLCEAEVYNAADSAEPETLYYYWDGQNLYHNSGINEKTQNAADLSEAVNLIFSVMTEEQFRQKYGDSYCDALYQIPLLIDNLSTFISGSDSHFEDMTLDKADDGYILKYEKDLANEVGFLIQSLQYYCNYNISWAIPIWLSTIYSGIDFDFLINKAIDTMNTVTVQEALDYVGEKLSPALAEILYQKAGSYIFETFLNSKDFYLWKEELRQDTLMQALAKIYYNDLNCSQKEELAEKLVNNFKKFVVTENISDLPVNFIGLILDMPISGTLKNNPYLFYMLKFDALSENLTLKTDENFRLTSLEYKGDIEMNSSEEGHPLHLKRAFRLSAKFSYGNFNPKLPENAIISQ